LAAMPIVSVEQKQLPAQTQRRWWSEALVDWAADFIETMFIRLSRGLIYILPLALAAYVAWKMLGG
ncbi:MAG: hypothetical protein AB7V02_11890, partial [Parvularculaceae bacterium]